MVTTRVTQARAFLANHVTGHRKLRRRESSDACSFCVLTWGDTYSIQSVRHYFALWKLYVSISRATRTGAEMSTLVIENLLNVYSVINNVM